MKKYQTDGISKLSILKSDIEAMEKFKGKAGIITNILKKIAFLRKYKQPEKNVLLIVKEAGGLLDNIETKESK